MLCKNVRKWLFDSVANANVKDHFIYSTAKRMAST